MTVQTAKARQTFTGDGTSGPFNASFKIFTDSDVVVTVKGVTQTLTTHYTVDNIDSDNETFDVTFTAGNEPASGDQIIVRRQIPRTQLTDYVENDPFPAETHEEGLDRAMMAIEDVQTQAAEFDKENTWSAKQTFSGGLDMNGAELIFDADGDTSITADTDDQIDVRIGGTDVGIFTGGSTPIFKVTDGTVEAQMATFTSVATFGSATNHNVTLTHNGVAQITLTGSVLEMSTSLDMDGNALIFDADADSKLFAIADDDLRLNVGGSEILRVDTGLATFPVRWSNITGMNFTDSTAQDSTTVGPTMRLIRDDGGVGTADDALGRLEAVAPDDGGSVSRYGSIDFKIKDPTAGAEEGRIDLRPVTNGSLTTAVSIVGEGSNTHVGIGETSPAGSLHAKLSGTLDVVRFQLDSNGATGGPELQLYRTSDSPAASDVLGDLSFRGSNDAVSDNIQYGRLFAVIDDPAAATASGSLVLHARINDTSTEVLRLGNDDATDPVSLRVGGAVEQVTQGAADSGGTGFRVLRVPN